MAAIPTGTSGTNIRTATLNTNRSVAVVRVFETLMINRPAFVVRIAAAIIYAPGKREACKAEGCDGSYCSFAHVGLPLRLRNSTRSPKRQGLTG